jgi:hypothetical protein
MTYLLMILLFSAANKDFFEFAHTYQEQGYNWKYVGKTSAESGYPHLEVYDSENNPVYYFQLFPPKETSNR